MSAKVQEGRVQELYQLMARSKVMKTPRFFCSVCGARCQIKGELGELCTYFIADRIGIRHP